MRRKAVGDDDSPVDRDHTRAATKMHTSASPPCFFSLFPPGAVTTPYPCGILLSWCDFDFALHARFRLRRRSERV